MVMASARERKDQRNTGPFGPPSRVLRWRGRRMDDRDYERYVRINLPHARTIVQRIGRSLEALGAFAEEAAEGELHETLVALEGTLRDLRRRPGGRRTRCPRPTRPRPRVGAWSTRSSRHPGAATAWASTCAISSSAWAPPTRAPPCLCNAASGPTRPCASARDRRAPGAGPPAGPAGCYSPRPRWLFCLVLALAAELDPPAHSPRSSRRRRPPSSPTSTPRSTAGVCGRVGTDGRVTAARCASTVRVSAGPPRAPAPRADVASSSWVTR